MITVDVLQWGDRARWAELWTGYLTFYKTSVPPEQYDHTWAGLMGGRFHGRGARDEHGQLQGIAHFMFQDTCWSNRPNVYLQDLFVDPSMRGHGVGRKLIEAVAEVARVNGSARLWWFTHHDNATARRLYDKVATVFPHVRYDYPAFR